MAASRSKLTGLLFIIYCVEAGVLLGILPWLPTWDAFVLDRAARWAALLTDPLMRGTITGFGLVHLVWALHDTVAWLRNGRQEHVPGS